MPITALDIANQALGVIDEAPIDAFSDDVKPARLMKLHYETTVEAELSKYAWAFAITTEAVDGFDTGTGSGTLAHEYEIPGDCLRILPLTHNGEVDGIPVSWEQRNGKIYSSSKGPLAIRYIARLIDPDDWTALFTEVLVAALAVKVAHPISHKQGMIDVARQAYEAALRAAVRANAFERGWSTSDRGWPGQRGDNRYWRA